MQTFPRHDHAFKCIRLWTRPGVVVPLSRSSSQPSRRHRSSKISTYHTLKAGSSAPHLSIYPSRQQRSYGTKSSSKKEVLQHYDGRQRLSVFWTPGSKQTFENLKEYDANDLLVRQGFITQTHPGIFQLLPLGLRIQEKLERLLDKHMTKLGASKVSLSTLSSQELWRKTGRLESGKSEFFKFQDRKDYQFLLSPTHEEEITTLVKERRPTWRDLPLRLYQISRKYRDEFRPRQGLLRTREFLMKDLYTFDATPESALETYEIVRQRYTAFFDEFKIPYLVAKAASGKIGGDLSHEYHFCSSKGEDNTISCDSCVYVANEELAERDDNLEEASSLNRSSELFDFAKSAHNQSEHFQQWFGITRDRNTLVQAIFPRRTLKQTQANLHILKVIYPELDTGIEHPLRAFTAHHFSSSGSVETPVPEKPFQILRIYDKKIPLSNDEIASQAQELIVNGKSHPVKVHSQQDMDLVRIESGDKCSRCQQGTLKAQATVELGHTFHLGTRYSKPLDATVVVNKADEPSQAVHMHMGCHGIGVSRLIATVADILRDDKGLNWPRAMAPFEAVIVTSSNNVAQQAGEIYDELVENGIDCIIDDRLEKQIGGKLIDADLNGYPVIVVMGRGLNREPKTCEVQCRRLGGFRKDVPVTEVRSVVSDLLRQL